MTSSWNDIALEEADQERTFPAPRTGGEILLAEDDAELRGLLAMFLRGEGYRVTPCADGLELLDHLGAALAAGRPSKFGLIITDVRMPGISGLAILRGTHGAVDAPPVILITAFGSQQLHTEARAFGARFVFDKPLDFDRFLATVRRVLPPA